MSRGFRSVAAVLASLACTAVALAALAGGAGAAGPTIPSYLDLITVAAVDSETAIAFGVVSSTKKKCVANRRIKMILNSATESQLFDLARSSDRGGWEAKGPAAAFDGSVISIEFKLQPRKVSTKGKPLRCGSDTVELFI